MKQHKLMGALAITGAFALALSGCAANNTGNTGDGGDKGGDTGKKTAFADYNPQPRENLKQGGTVNIREKDGVKLSVVYPVFSDDPTQAALAQSFQKMEKEVGIDLKIDVRPSNKFAEDYNSKNWDVASLRFTSSDPYGVGDMFQLYGADQGLNLSGVWSDETDAEIHEIEKIGDGDKQIAAAMKLEPKLLEGWGLISLYNGPSISAAKKGLANLTPEAYVGLDGFGIQPVENVGWEK
ncbi:hypothetical protein ACUOFU_15595 [Microbacterium arabinogalactanolyticum]|uniref:hypothetical protein n=1 Tax=Microbacterium arabinogalactanolyticum TaxID=69365 RepID=UPI004043BDA8